MAQCAQRWVHGIDGVHMFGSRDGAGFRVWEGWGWKGLGVQREVQESALVEQQVDGPAGLQGLRSKTASAPAPSVALKHQQHH